MKRETIHVAWSAAEHGEMRALATEMGYPSIGAWLTDAAREVAAARRCDTRQGRDRRRLRDLAIIYARAYAAGLDEGVRRVGAQARHARVDDATPLRLVVGER